MKDAVSGSKSKATHSLMAVAAVILLLGIGGVWFVKFDSEKKP